MAVLVQGLNDNKVNAKNVFNLADKGASGSASIYNLGKNFKSILPNVNPQIIGEAMKSFGTDSSTKV